MTLNGVHSASVERGCRATRTDEMCSAMVAKYIRASAPVRATIDACNSSS